MEISSLVYVRIHSQLLPKSLEFCVILQKSLQDQKRYLTEISNKGKALNKNDPYQKLDKLHLFKQIIILDKIYIVAS